jgi:hypothetical protein
MTSRDKAYVQVISRSQRTVAIKGEKIMSFSASSIVNSHELRTHTPDNKDLVFLTGMAVINPGFTGTGQTWHADQLTITIGPVWQHIDNVAPVAALASISNDQTAVDAGWATDYCTWNNVNGKIELAVGLAVRDIDGHVLRVAYQATAIGKL